MGEITQYLGGFWGMLHLALKQHRWVVQPSLVEGFRQQVHFEHICPASASGKPGNPISKIGPMGTNVLVDVSTGISLALDPAMHAHKLTKREREREREIELEPCSEITTKTYLEYWWWWWTEQRWIVRVLTCY